MCVLDFGFEIVTTPFTFFNEFFYFLCDLGFNVIYQLYDWPKD